MERKISLMRSARRGPFARDSEALRGS